MNQNQPTNAPRSITTPHGSVFFDGSIVFGCGPILPISNLPAGVLKVRIRQREDQITKVYLKFWDHTEAWEVGLSPCRRYWQLDVSLERNAVRR